MENIKMESISFTVKKNLCDNMNIKKKKKKIKLCARKGIKDDYCD